MKNILTSIDEIHTSINNINSICYRFKEILKYYSGNTDLLDLLRGGIYEKVLILAVLFLQHLV